MSDTILRITSHSYLLVSEHVVHTIGKYCQTGKNFNESGGMLYGRLRSHSHKFTTASPPHIEITHCSEPGRGDSSNRYGFIRRGRHHFQKLAKLRHKSGNTITYLGEWHSHPEDFPSPSVTDLRSWKVDFKNNLAVVAIVGRKQIWWGYWDGNQAKQLNTRC